MGKTVLSPVEHFTGHVVIAMPMTMAQGAAFDEANQAAQEIKKVTRSLTRFQMTLLPAIFACVDEWHIANIEPSQLSPETFPATPRQQSAELIAWLINEVSKVYIGEKEIPLV